MPRESKTYEVQIYYQTVKTVRVKAKTRPEAIEKVSDRAKTLGVKPISMWVPFLEGDE